MSSLNEVVSNYEKEYAENYGGRGASFEFGARWNMPRVPVLYFSTSVSVAMIEVANYVPSPHALPSSMILGVYELSEKVRIKQVEEKELPKDWRGFPHSENVQVFGTEILCGNRYDGMVVPSASIPVIDNTCVVINADRLDRDSIKLISIENQIYDQRMFSGI